MYTSIEHFCPIRHLQKRTKYTHVDAKYENVSIDGNWTLRLVHDASDTVPAGTMVDPKGSLNILGLVVFSVVFGAVLSRLGEKGLPLRAFFEALNEVVMKMVTLVMWCVYANMVFLFLEQNSMHLLTGEKTDPMSNNQLPNKNRCNVKIDQQLKQFDRGRGYGVFSLTNHPTTLPPPPPPTSGRLSHKVFLSQRTSDFLYERTHSRRRNHRKKHDIYKICKALNFLATEGTAEAP